MSKPRKTYYVSFNQVEIDKLSVLASHSEIALYFTLKNLASFETGWVGFFGNQRLSYEALARKLSRPPSQGKPAAVVNKDQVRHLLDRLTALGLVAQQQIVGDGRLVMHLPLSPIEPIKPADKKTQEQTTAAELAADPTTVPMSMDELLAEDEPDNTALLERLCPALYVSQKGVRAETLSPSGVLEEVSAEQ
jgi:hypothetical protein